MLTRIDALRRAAEKGAHAGALWLWKPQLSLAASTVGHALNLSFRQWLVVVLFAVVFCAGIAIVLFIIEAVTARMDQAEAELAEKMDALSDQARKPSPRIIGSQPASPRSMLASVRGARPEPVPEDLSQPRFVSETTSSPRPQVPTAEAELPVHQPSPGEPRQVPPLALDAAQRWRLTAGDRTGSGFQALLDPADPSKERGTESHPEVRYQPEERSWTTAPGHTLGSKSEFAAFERSGTLHSIGKLRRGDSFLHGHSHHHDGLGTAARRCVLGSARRREIHHDQQHLTEDHVSAAESGSAANESVMATSGKPMYTVQGDEIVDDMGISGMCLVCSHEKMPIVLAVAVQAFFIQFLILFFIAQSLTPNPNFSAQKALPKIIVDIAIYLHFIGCVRDLPRSLFVLRFFHQVHSTWVDTLVFGFIYVVDAFITPLSQLFIGALFLCTSVTVTDVIMNSCAIAYISSIDNMILEVRKQMNSLALDDEEFGDVVFPVNPQIVKALNFTFCVVPIFPMTFCFSMAYLGIYVFHL